jgi:hypothetical protein
MAQVLEVDIDNKTAQLYTNGDAWHIEREVNSPEKWTVIGPAPAREFATLAALIAAPDLPELVKWAARGLAGIPL